MFKTIELTIHNMTTNIASSPYIASASSAYSSLFEAFRCFDGGLGSNQYWIGTGNGVDWLKIQVPYPTTLSNYTLYANTIPEAARMVKNWTMEGSADDSTYVVLDTRTNETTWGSGEGRNYSCQIRPTTLFSYFKLNITANNGDATYTVVAEMYLYHTEKYYYLHERRGRMNMQGVSLQGMG